MRVEDCKCGGDSACPICEGCGEVVIFTALEIRKLRRYFQGKEMEPLSTAGMLNKEQTDRFIKRVLEPAGFELRGESNDNSER